METFGLIVYHHTDNGEIEFHVSQRRDTLAYIHFIKGGVPYDMFEIFFKRMTVCEKERLLKYNFNELWNDLFVSSLQDKDHYFRAREKFEELKKTGLLERLCHNTLESIELEWGIPKGRKLNFNEPDIICAHREYREETNSKCYLEFLDYPPLICKNAVRNETIKYFIAKSKYRPSPKYDVIGNIRRSVSDETNDVRWVTPSNFKILPQSFEKILQEVVEILKYPQTFLLLQDVIAKFSHSHPRIASYIASYRVV